MQHDPHISGAADESNHYDEDQAGFLAFVDAAMEDERDTRCGLFGGPGSGKTFTMQRAAALAQARSWAVLLIGPTHQATGVLAGSVPGASPLDPNPEVPLRAGMIYFATAHRFASWRQEGRSAQAAAGVANPAPRDSWRGRALAADVGDPPRGWLIVLDEASMYTGQMVVAIDVVAATLRQQGRPVILVAVGDEDQLAPVRGPNYEYVDGEAPQQPSPLVDLAAHDRSFRLGQNHRTDLAEIREAVETYKQRGVILPPAPERPAYRWVEAGPEIEAEMAERMREDTLHERPPQASAFAVSYLREQVANMNRTLSLSVHEHDVNEIRPGDRMRVQSTYCPSGLTLLASSDIVRIGKVWWVDGDENVSYLLPPRKGHSGVYRRSVMAAFEAMLDDLPPMMMVEMRIGRSSVTAPVEIVGEGAEQPSAHFWKMLVSRVQNAARMASDRQQANGLRAIAYHLLDNARVKIEPPFAMTSHRAQGSTFDEVYVLADSPAGGRVVNHWIEDARRGSTYVMMSRARSRLTIVWQPQNELLAW